MYSIKKGFISFYRCGDFIFNELSNQKSTFEALDNSPDSIIKAKRIYIYSSGLLNYFWHSWNRFWRVYWLCHIIGGKDFNNNRVIGSRRYSEPEALFYMLFLLGKRHTAHGRVSGSYQEPTWGDIKIIEDLSIRLFGPGSKILSALSVFGDTVKHLQWTRNASIHIDNNNVNKIKYYIIPHYNITRIKYPTDVLFSRCLTNNKITFKSWIDELRSFLLMI